MEKERRRDQCKRRSPKSAFRLHPLFLRKEAAINSTGSAPDEDSVAIDQGSVDWVAVMKAVQNARIEHYFIEDEAKNAVDQVPQSLRYLEALQD